MVLRNIKEASLRYSENKRLHTLRFDSTILLKVVRRILQNFFYVYRLFVPLGTQSVCSFVFDPLCFLVPLLDFPSHSLSLDHTCFFFLDWSHSLWLQTWSHTRADTSFWFPTEAILNLCFLFLSHPPFSVWSDTVDSFKEKVTSSIKTPVLG